MSGMFWIALELSIPKIGFNIMLSLTVKKLGAFKFDGVAESDNTASTIQLGQTWLRIRWATFSLVRLGVVLVYNPQIF